MSCVARLWHFDNNVVHTGSVIRSSSQERYACCSVGFLSRCDKVLRGLRSAFVVLRGCNGFVLFFSLLLPLCCGLTIFLLFHAFILRVTNESRVSLPLVGPECGTFWTHKKIRTVPDVTTTTGLSAGLSTTLSTKINATGCPSTCQL